MTTTAEPRAGEIDERLMDRGRRAGVDAPGRLADDQHLGPLQDLAAHDEFLQVAARERAGERARAGRLDGEGADHFAGVVWRALPGSMRPKRTMLHAVAPGQRRHCR